MTPTEVRDLTVDEYEAFVRLQRKEVRDSKRKK